jgi:hypothetical protein
MDEFLDKGKKSFPQRARVLIKNRGYKLLSELEHARDVIVLQCHCGEIFSIKYSNFYTRNNCPACVKVKFIEDHPQRNKYEDVKNFTESVGYSLVSESYKNTKTKLMFKCPVGHEFEMQYNNFKHGQRCPYCCGHIKLTYDRIKENIETRGYSLLTPEEEFYKNTQKLITSCSRGHIYSVTHNNFVRGHRCRKCNRIEILLKKDYPKNREKLLTYHLRSMLLDSWTIPCLKRSGYLCDLTGEKGSNNNILRVHHIYPFVKILEETLVELGLKRHKYCESYSPIELYNIESLIKEKHKVENGFVIGNKYHRAFHKKYGNNSTKEQLEEFIKDFKKGEFYV